MGGVAVAAVNEIVSAGEGRGSDGGITTATVGETVDHGLLRGNHLAKLGQLLLKGVQLRSKVAQGHGILRIRGIGQPLQLSAAGIVAIRRHVRQALAFIPQIACILQLLIGHIATQVGSRRNRRFVPDERLGVLIRLFPVRLHLIGNHLCGDVDRHPLRSICGERTQLAVALRQGDGHIVYRGHIRGVLNLRIIVRRFVCLFRPSGNVRVGFFRQKSHSAYHPCNFIHRGSLGNIRQRDGYILIRVGRERINAVPFCDGQDTIVYGRHFGEVLGGNVAGLLQLLRRYIAAHIRCCRNCRFVLDEGWRILVCFFPVSLHPFTVAPIESLYGERHGTHSGINRGNCGGAVLDYASDSSIRPIDGSPCWRIVTDLNGDQTILVTGHVLNGLAIQHVLTRTEDTHLHRQRGIVHQFIVAVTNHRLVTQFLGEHLRRQQ